MVKSVELGTCCVDCYDAINFSPVDLAIERAKAAREAGAKLSALADKENVSRLFTGNEMGFRWSHCAGCGSPLGGERFALYGHEQRRDER